MGAVAAQAVLDYRHHDGSNQLGEEPGGTPGVAYSDYTGYRPVNTWDKVNNPDHWQPLCILTPPPGATECTGRIQTYLTPFWAKVKPFALTSPGQFRPPGPYTYLGSDGKPSGKYVDEIDKMTQYSKQLDDFRKTTAEGHGTDESGGRQGHGQRPARPSRTADEGGEAGGRVGLVELGHQGGLGHGDVVQDAEAADDDPGQQQAPQRQAPTAMLADWASSLASLVREAAATKTMARAAVRPRARAVPTTAAVVLGPLP